MRGYSSEQLQNIRVITNLINRVNKLNETFGHKSLDYQKGANLLFDLGFAPVGGSFKTPKKSELAEVNMSTLQRKRAESVPTAYNILQRVSAKISGKFETTPNREKAIERVQSEYEISDWIESNIESIYNYEEQYGNVITGHSGTMSYDELYQFKSNIEQSDVPTSGWGWIDDSEFPDE